MLKPIRICSLLTILLTANNYVAFAEEGYFHSQQVHKNWTSGLFKINNSSNPRMATFNQNQVLLIDESIIADKRTIYATILEEKPKKDKGTKIFTDPVDTKCELRVDKKMIYPSKCAVDDDNSFYSLYLMIPDGLLEDCKSGNTLRIKLSPNEEDDSSKAQYYRFSLFGFSAAYARFQILSNSSSENNDADFFKNLEKNKNKKEQNNKEESTITPNKEKINNNIL